MQRAVDAARQVDVDVELALEAKKRSQEQIEARSKLLSGGTPYSIKYNDLHTRGVGGQPAVFKPDELIHHHHGERPNGQEATSPRSLSRRDHALGHQSNPFGRLNDEQRFEFINAHNKEVLARQQAQILEQSKNNAAAPFVKYEHDAVPPYPDQHQQPSGATNIAH